MTSQGYDLSINRYKEHLRAEEKYDDPRVILKKLQEMESDILKELTELEELLG